MKPVTALPLPLARVQVSNHRLAIDFLTIEDETAVRLAAERGDPVRFVVEAIEIGARVLDREQTGANAEFVRAEFEKTARELDAAFVERARAVAQRLDEKVDEVFGPEHGHVTKALARHFGDESSTAVQHRVRAVLGEVSAQMREDLRKQLSADTDSNPLAVFQRTHLAQTRQIADQQAAVLRETNTRLEAMRVEIAELRAEREKLSEIAAVQDKGTAKGRTYEESVAEALLTIAAARGDDCDAVGDVRGEGGKKGDVVVAIDACARPGARQDRLRGQELQAVEERGAGRARRGDGDARGRLRGARRLLRGQAAGPHASAARVQRRQAVRDVRSRRRARRSRSRSPTASPAPAC